MKITHRITTGLVALMMMYSSILYITNPMMEQAFQHLGFPAYFRIELAIAKAIGVILLLAPVGALLKEWAYAGFTIVLVSAFIAHSASGDPISAQLMPLIFLTILLVSYITYRKLPKREKKQQSHLNTRHTQPQNSYVS